MTAFRQCACCQQLPAWGVSPWCQPCLRGARWSPWFGPGRPVSLHPCRIGRACGIRRHLGLDPLPKQRPPPRVEEPPTQ